MRAGRRGRTVAGEGGGEGRGRSYETGGREAGGSCLNDSSLSPLRLPQAREGDSAPDLRATGLGEWVWGRIMGLEEVMVEALRAKSRFDNGNMSDMTDGLPARGEGSLGGRMNWERWG